MKKLTILLFSILISFSSYGKWEELFESVDGDTYYIDTDTIKEHKGYVYYWKLVDRIKPMDGIMSYKSYIQGDCGEGFVLLKQHRRLSFILYKQPMGRGTGHTNNSPNEWTYPSPSSVGGGVLNYVCNYVD